jgi:hypothetical protein
MSNNVRKSSLEQAKADFEEIRRFAQQQIESKLQEEVDKKILEVINEEINISVDEDGNVEVEKDGEEVFTTSTSSEHDEETDVDPEDEFIEVSDDEEEIEVSDEEQKNENMLEMNRMTNEAEAAPAAAPAPAAPAAEPTAAPMPEAPVAEEPVAEEPVAEEPVAEEGGDKLEQDIEELVSKMDTLINVLMQQQGVSADQQAGEQEFEVVDDEAEVAPAAEAPAAPAAPAAPVQEDMTFEIEEFEEGTDLLEIIDELEGGEDVDYTMGNENDPNQLPNPPKEIIINLDEDNTETIEIVDEDEMPQEGWGMEEMQGVGHNLRHSNTLGKQPRQGVEHRHELNESKKIKAQYESKIGELTQENKGLQTELKSLKLERKEFEDAFIQLREQFDEMQTFNGKLALVNKLLMNGGLSFDQKLTVCEQFDGADTIEEAEKIYKSIIKENNIKVGDASNKIKASTTHTAKVSTESKPLYESEEARRMKQLAGMTKRLED